MNTNKHHYYVCLKNEGYEASLEIRKIYQCLPDPKAEEHHQVRIIDESGEDYLYPDNIFAEINIPDSLEEALSEAA